MEIANNKIDSATLRKWPFHERYLKRMPPVVLALFITLPLILLGTYSCIREFTHQTRTAIERRDSLAQLGALLIHEKLHGLIDIGTLLASRPSVYQNIEKGNWDEATKNIEKVPHALPYIDTIGLFDTDGVLRATIPPMPDAIGKNFAYRDYYQGVSKEWIPYVSEAFQRAVEPKYNVISIAVPLHSSSRAVLGFLLLTIKLDTILGWSKEIDIGPQGFVYIVDKNGQVVAHSTKQDAALLNYSSYPVVQKLLQGERGIAILPDVEKKDEKTVTAYAPAQDHGFGIAIGQPARTSFAERNRNITAMAVTWLFLVCTIFFFLYSILKSRAKIVEQHNREHLFLEAIGDGVVAIDRDWRIVLWNRAASNITGWSEAEAIGQSFRTIIRLIHENSRRENISFIEDAIVMNRPSSVDIGTLLIKKDGNEIAVGDSAAPLVDLHGEVHGAIIVFRDASKERETMHMRSDFVYASHQLRTPITEALWNLALLKKDGDPGKKVENLEAVECALMSIQRLSEHLVSVSEIDQGSLSAKRSTTKLVDMFNNVQSALEKKAKECGVTLSFDPVPMLAALNTDAKLFQKSLYEVIENALLYSTARTDVRVHITIKEKELLVDVVDTGIGIPEEEQPAIFTKFFRASNRPQKKSGSGLGLYIARAYIRALDGKIWFTSEEGKGSTFSILLPIV